MRPQPQLLPANRRQISPRRPVRSRLAGNFGDEKPPRRERHPERFSVPGAPIPETGIYEVIHDNGHRGPHEAVLHRGDLFPECDTCRTKVRFRLIRNAPYIFDDEDFAPE